jgi:endonuclease YncB( thermonuclease family)
LKYFPLILFLLYQCSKPTEGTNANSNPLIDSVAVVTCTRVIDGDTWCFMLKTDEIHVRVLNIDCYEIKKDSRLQKQADSAGITLDSALILGKKQKEIANNLLLNNPVKIVRDYSQKNFDAYNRLLRICYINNMLYDSLIKI